MAIERSVKNEAFTGEKLNGRQGLRATGERKEKS
jgi:hypothetical protein